MLIQCPKQWSEMTFGSCELGDQRRTQRLVQVAAGLARHIGQSMVKSCANDAEIEGAYRLIRNNEVSSTAMAEGGFKATARLAAQADTLLALEDSTSLSFQHSVRESLGPVSNNKDSQHQGFMVHSVLLVDAGAEQTVGLIEQSRWTRSAEAHGKKHQRKYRAYNAKESSKWQKASEAMSERLGAVMGRTISVCDRESDIYDYLSYKVTQQQRFIVRVAQNRSIEGSGPGRLFELTEQLQGVGQYRINVPQKGGRKARKATMEISYAPVALLSPKNRKADQPTLSLTVVQCREITKHQKDGLHWLLLTQEPVSSAAQARQIVHYYEQRWKIEEYHKAWKSGGTQVEKQRMQMAGNLERMVVILGFIAVRLLQLREVVMGNEQAKKLPCTQLLQPVEWQVLWLKRERHRLPSTPPSLHWAYYALAKLGGWYDSKRTGKVGWSALWEGWFKLEQLVEGATLSASLPS